MASRSTKLTVTPRSSENSRATRRLRRAGLVPGVLYGGGEDPVAFSVNERELRLALAGRGAVLDVALTDSSSSAPSTSPAVLKDAHYHPVRGETLHVDLLRVNLEVAIHSVVGLELTGAEDAPGAREGGVLEHVTREVNVEALPHAIPEVITLDVSAMVIGDTLNLSAVTAPEGVTLLDDLEETVVATLTPPRLEEEPEEGIEEETELVGEGQGEAEGSADADDVPADAGDTGTE